MKNKNEVKITTIDFTTDNLIINLSDGREIALTTSKKPWLLNATESQRKNWSVIKGKKIHWTELNEGIQFETFNKIGICKLCLNRKILQKESHIIPRFVIKQSNIMDEKGIINEVAFDAGKNQIKSQIEKSGSVYIERNILFDNGEYIFNITIFVM